MATKARAKKAKAASNGKTATQVYVELLSRKEVPSDETLLKEAKQRAPHSHPTPQILAWYKTKFRQGALPGLDGKPQVINQ